MRSAGDERWIPRHGVMSSYPGSESMDSTTPFGAMATTRSCRPSMPLYRVGELLKKGRRAWPAGSEFAFGPGGHELTIFQASIEPGLVEDVRRGPAEFALIVEAPVIVLAFRFGETGRWEEAPYCWHLQPEFRQIIPAAAEAAEARALLWITLVGADDGLIHAQRGMTLSPPFTRALHDAIRRQAMSPFDPKHCTAAISRLFVDCPNPGDRLRSAIARTLGNG